MITRRNLVISGGTLLATAMTSFSTLPQAQAATDGPEIGDNGLHIQEWFLESFMDLQDDRAEAAAQGKSLVLLFEQRGCPYCAEMHRVNFAREEIVEYIKANFEILQVDLWGSRGMTDLDGTELEEKKLARRWRVNFTPTMVFIKEGTEGTDPVELEVARMPGYFKPYHFISMFEFVQKKKFEQMPFQRYLLEKQKILKEKGLKPEIW